MQERARAPDHRVLAELLKDARLSDSRLAKILRVSESTAARRRLIVEKELIDSYVAFPKFEKIGFEIIAFTFVRGSRMWLEKSKINKAFETVKDWLDKHPNVVFASDGEGMGFGGVMISFHRSYSEFVEFKRRHDQELSQVMGESKSFIADLNPEAVLKPFHLKYLAEVK